jgi:hypothetical protein
VHEHQLVTPEFELRPLAKTSEVGHYTTIHEAMTVSKVFIAPRLSLFSIDLVD